MRTVQLSTELGLGVQASVVVEDIERQMTAQEQFVRRLDCWSQVRSVADGSSATVTLPAHVPDQLHHTVRSSIMALAIRRL